MPYRPAIRSCRHHDPMLALALIAFGLASLPLAAQTAPDATPPGPTASDTGNAGGDPPTATPPGVAAPTDAAAGGDPARPGDCPPPGAQGGTASPATAGSGQNPGQNPGQNAGQGSGQAAGQDDATAPSNSGSSGWSGGLGGSHIGTTPSGSAPESPTWQPPTARGLDLKGRPPAEPGC